MADPFSFVMMTVAQIGISFLFPSQGPRLKDLKLSASTYGAAIPDGFGFCRFATNLIWSSGIEEHKVPFYMMGKGLGNEFYYYTCSFAVGVCKGPVSLIRRVWADHKLIYDATGESPVVVKKQHRFRAYKGTETQLPDSLIVADKGEDNAPGYRGLCYIVFQDLPLQDYGNRIPQIEVEVYIYGDGTATASGPKFTVSNTENYDNIEEDSMAVDPNRGYAYMIDNDGQIRRFRLTDGLEDMIFKNGPFGTDTVSDVSQIGNVSRWSGNVILGHGFGNSIPYSVNEPITLHELGRVGVASSSTSASSPHQSHGVFSTTFWGDEYYCYVSLFGDLFVFQTAPTVGGLQNLATHMFGTFGTSTLAAVDGGETPEFWWWEGNRRISGYIPYLRLWQVTRDIFGVWHLDLRLQIDNPSLAEGGFDAQNIHYDESDGGFLLQWRTGGKRMMGKWDPITEEFRWTKQLTMGLAANAMPVPLQYGQFAWTDGDRVYHIDTINGNFLLDEPNDHITDYIDSLDVPKAVAEAPPDEDYDGIPVSGSGTGDDLVYYDVYTDSLIVAGGVPGGRPGHIVKPGAVTEGDTSLAAFVKRILRRGGLSDRYMDMTLLEGTQVKGYGWAGATDIKGVLDQLRRLYLFDLIERDGKLVGVMRDAGSDEDTPGKIVRNITHKVLGSTGDGTSMDYWQETRIQDADLPSRVTLAYMNFDDDFQSSVARSVRISDPVPTMFSRQQVAMEVNVVMTPAEAKNQANKILWTQWSERFRHNTRVPWAYLDCDPADLVKVTLADGRTFQERLHHTEFGADFALALETFSADLGSYESDAIADGGGVGTTTIVPSYPARPFILNTPLLRDQDDRSGTFSIFYTGVGNTTSYDFQGASLHRSKNALDWTTLYATDDDVEWGIVEGVLASPARGNFALDWETTVTIWPAGATFELESISDDELWAGGNACMIGDEVIQFRDAVQNGNGSWTISNLLRGRRGTEYACDTHVDGEVFVFLSSSTIQVEGETIDSRGQSRYYKAVSQEQSLLQATPLSIVYEPRDLMPYAPKDIRRSYAGDTCTLSWKRRTRMGGNMMDYTGTVPLQESSEAYEIYILSEAFDGDLSRGGQAPTNTIYETTSTTSEVTFDVTEFTAPFDVDLDTLHVVIYQKSAVVGRGFPGVRSIEPWRAF